MASRYCPRSRAMQYARYEPATGISRRDATLSRASKPWSVSPRSMTAIAFLTISDCALSPIAIFALPACTAPRETVSLITDPSPFGEGLAGSPARRAQRLAAETSTPLPPRGSARRDAGHALAPVDEQ